MTTTEPSEDTLARELWGATIALAESVGVSATRLLRTSPLPLADATRAGRSAVRVLAWQSAELALRVVAAHADDETGAAWRDVVVAAASVLIDDAPVDRLGELLAALAGCMGSGASRFGLVPREELLAALGVTMVALRTHATLSANPDEPVFVLVALREATGVEDVLSGLGGAWRETRESMRRDIEAAVTDVAPTSEALGSAVGILVRYARATLRGSAMRPVAAMILDAIAAAKRAKSPACHEAERRGAVARAVLDAAVRRWLPALSVWAIGVANESGVTTGAMAGLRRAAIGLVEAPGDVSVHRLGRMARGVAGVLAADWEHERDVLLALAHAAETLVSASYDFGRGDDASATGTLIDALLPTWPMRPEFFLPMASLVTTDIAAILLAASDQRTALTDTR